jgi:hypothetical protein
MEAAWQSLGFPDCGSAAEASLSSLRLLSATWLILTSFVANGSLIALSVDLFDRLIYVGPSGRRLLFSRTAHGFLSNRIKVFISAVAAGPDRLDIERFILVVEGSSAWTGPMETSKQSPQCALPHPGWSPPHHGSPDKQTVTDKRLRPIARSGVRNFMPHRTLQASRL